MRRTAIRGWRRLLSHVLGALVLVGMVAAIAPARAQATVGYSYQPFYRRFKVTVYWHVNNPFSTGGHQFDAGRSELALFGWGLQDPYHKANSNKYTSENIIYFNNDRSAGADFSYGYLNTASALGDHSCDFYMDTPPDGLYFQIYGKGVDAAQWFITKVEVETVNPVEGVYIPTKRVLWEGMLGAHQAHMTGATNSCELRFDQDEPRFTAWENDTATKKTTETYDYDTTAMGTPHPVGITEFGAIEDMDVRTDNGEVRQELSPGVLYDNYGAPWPLQRFEITTDKDEIRIEHTDGEDYGDLTHDIMCIDDETYYNTAVPVEGAWEIVVPPSANAKEDYVVTVDQHVYNGVDHATSAQFTVHTFDYEFTFVDVDGTVLGKQTVDYGDEVVPPEVDSPNVRYICDQYDDWRNTTDGPQARTVMMLRDLEGGGTTRNPYLIKNSSDWESLRLTIENDKSNKMVNKHYRLESDIRVDTMIGTAEWPFTGYFDGNGHSITIDYVSDDQETMTAPFAYTRDADFKNLTVYGRIRGSGGYAAGLIGKNEGVTFIDNCRVNADISGDQYIGGMCVVAGGTLFITNSIVDGILRGGVCCGGFVASGTSGTEIRYSLLDLGTESTVDEGATFVYGDYNVLADCYYVNPYGEPQGREGHRIGHGGSFELGHDLTAHPAVAATCTKAGNTAYWSCNECGKYFADEEGTQEIEEGSWVVEPEGHTWKTRKIKLGVLGAKVTVKVKVCTKCKHAIRVSAKAYKAHNTIGRLLRRLPVLSLSGRYVELSLDTSKG